MRSGTIVLKDKEKIPDDLGVPFCEKLHGTLESGQREVIPGNGASVLVDNQAMEIFAGSHVLICIGTLVILMAQISDVKLGFVADIGREKANGTS